MPATLVELEFILEVLYTGLCYLYILYSGDGSACASSHVPTAYRGFPFQSYRRGPVYWSRYPSTGLLELHLVGGGAIFLVA